MSVPFFYPLIMGNVKKKTATLSCMKATYYFNMLLSSFYKSGVSV